MILPEVIAPEKTTGFKKLPEVLPVTKSPKDAGQIESVDKPKLAPNF
jgi:hypothetical protein